MSGPPFVRRLVRLCCVMLFFAAGGAVAQTVQDATVSSFSLSRDGRLLNFSFPVTRNGVLAIASRQLDWRTGQIRPWAEPYSFGYTEDPSIVFRVVLDDNPDHLKQVPEAIALYDYPSLQLKQTIRLSKIPEDNPRRASTWSPWKKIQIRDVNIATRQALCTVHGEPAIGICLYDLKTGKHTIVVSPQEGFGTIFHAWLGERDEVFLSAWDSKDEKVKADLRDLNRSIDFRYRMMPYRVKLGEKPQTVYQDILRRGFEIGGAPSNFTPSCGGRRVAYFDVSPGEDEPMKRARRERRPYPYRVDAYVREGGTQRAVTNLKTYMAHLAISCDGSTLAFGTYVPPPGGSQDPGDEPWTKRKFEPSIVDLTTNQLVPLHLVDRLRNDPSIAKD